MSDFYYDKAKEAYRKYKIYYGDYTNASTNKEKLEALYNAKGYLNEAWERYLHAETNDSEQMAKECERLFNRLTKFIKDLENEKIIHYYSECIHFEISQADEKNVSYLERKLQDLSEIRIKLKDMSDNMQVNNLINECNKKINLLSNIKLQITNDKKNMTRIKFLFFGIVLAISFIMFFFLVSSWKMWLFTFIVSIAGTFLFWSKYFKNTDKNYKLNSGSFIGVTILFIIIFSIISAFMNVSVIWGIGEIVLIAVLWFLLFEICNQ